MIMSEQEDDILFGDAPQPLNADYSEDDIQTLDWKEHIQRRPGMYIGKLGDGTNSDDGIYVLIKEVLDNSIDEYMMGFGRVISVDVDAVAATVRDYGRGIPLGKLIDVSSKMNTGAKYDSAAFKKSVGLNGVGIKAVNALSTSFEITAFRDGKCKRARFCMGALLEECDIEDTDEPNGTLVRFTPSADIFKSYAFREEFIIPLLKNYTFLNTGLTINFNGVRYLSRHGLLDLLKENMTQTPLYPIIHLKGQDIEVAITHVNQYGEEYYSFVNGQHTTQGGTHLSAFKEAVSRTLKDYFNRNFEYSDIRNGMVAAVAVKVEEPVFESQTKTRLGSREMSPDGVTIAKYIGDFIRKELDNYLHRNLEVADIVLKKVQESERDRKAMAGVAKKARETAKKVSLYNRKLNDCRVHLNDTRGNDEKKEASSIFITEGDSAGGSIEKVRNVETQAVFKLRGKPLNTYGATKKELYTNEEFSLLQAALNIEDGIEIQQGDNRHRCRCRRHAHPSAHDNLLPAVFPRPYQKGTCICVADTAFSCPQQENRQAHCPCQKGRQCRRYCILLHRRRAHGGHSPFWRQLRDNPIQGSRRNFAGGVPRLHWPRHAHRPCESA